MILTIIEILVYCLFSFYFIKLVMNYFLKRKANKVSNTAKRELKARYFKLCEEIVLSVGTNPNSEYGVWGKTSIGEMQKISVKMCNAGMEEIVKQELDNMKKLCIDLGYTEGYKNEW